MIFNIASKLNVNMLNEKICQFRHSAIGHERPYIFMSQETAIDVYIEVHEPVFDEEMGGMIGTYSGNKLFIIPEMRYGEIELR